MKKSKTNKIEILAPAGNMDKMKTALAHGADAVYAGIPDFSLRVRINDFDIKKIAEGVGYCHARGKKLYVTINIFAHNEHIAKLPPYIKQLKKIGVDALIISDPGIIYMVKEIWPEAEIHLSTQANCTNWQAAKFWYELGLKRVILGRETTLRDIKEIKKKVPKLDLEVFVHGAMCMSYSGRCFLSKYFVDRSGNLGDCVQPCRWKYRMSDGGFRTSDVGCQTSDIGCQISDSELSGSVFITEEKRPNQPLEVVEDEHGSYILNSKDLCLLKYLKDLRDAGVMSFKIEGRAKSAYYQALTAGIYSRVTHNLNKITNQEINKLYKELETKITNRGYSTGFILGEKGEEDTENPHQKIDWQFCGVVVNLDNKKAVTGNSRIFVKIHNVIKIGDDIEVVLPQYEIKKLKVKKIIDTKNDQEIFEAHGGAGGKIVELELKGGAPEFSVLRRKVV